MYSEEQLKTNRERIQFIQLTIEEFTTRAQLYPCSHIERQTVLLNLRAEQLQLAAENAVIMNQIYGN